MLELIFLLKWDDIRYESSSCKCLHNSNFFAFVLVGEVPFSSRRRNVVMCFCIESTNAPVVQLKDDIRVLLSISVNWCFIWSQFGHVHCYKCLLVGMSMVLFFILFTWQNSILLLLDAEVSPCDFIEKPNSLMHFLSLFSG